MSRYTILTLAGLVAAGGCASSYQTARIAAPGKTRVSTAASHVSFDGGGDDEGIDAIDLLVDHGLASQAEIGLRYTNYAAGDGGGSLLSLGPKFGLVKDRVAVTIPVGVAWANDEIGAYIIHPRLIGSAPLSPNSEVTGSFGVLVVVPDGDDADSESYFGGSVGLRLSTDLDAWAFHPEISFMKIEEGDSFSIGAAISFVL
jgi:hypothetical protein